MAIRCLLRSFSPYPHHPNPVHELINRLYLHSVAAHSMHRDPINPSSSSHHLVNELARVLSDHRNPQDDVETALAPFTSMLSTDLVEQVLKRCKNLGFAAHRFFIWSLNIPGFQHSPKSYRILIDILGSSRQFPILWDFLTGMKNTETCEISREIFWIIFRNYSRSDLPGDAIRAFNKMIDFGINPCIDDLDQLMLSLSKRKHMKRAQEFFDRVKDGHLTPTVKTYSIVIRGWGDMGDADKARNLFDEMLKREKLDLLALNSILHSLCKGGKVDEAYKLFRGMRENGLEPDSYSYSIFVQASCKSGNIHTAFQALDSMKRHNLVPNVFTYNCVIKNLCKDGKLDEAHQMLDEMIDRGLKPDTWSYNTILSAHCDRNEVNNALKLISRMDRDKCKQDSHTYNMALKMLVRVGRFDRAENVWRSMEDGGFHPSASTYSVMIHGLCKKRWKLDEACDYFERMIDGGIPPYDTTCVLLRNKVVGLGFADRIDVLVGKMERSSCVAIRDASGLMRGNRGRPRVRGEDRFSDESDEGKDWLGVHGPTKD